MMNVWELLLTMLGWGLVVIFALLSLVVVITIFGVIARLIRRGAGRTKRMPSWQVRKAADAEARARYQSQGKPMLGMVQVFKDGVDFALEARRGN